MARSAACAATLRFAVSPTSARTLSRLDEATTIEIELLLHLEDAAHRRIDARLREPTFTHTGDDGVDRRGNVARHQQNVGARGDRELARFGDADAVVDGRRSCPRSSAPRPAPPARR